MTETTFLGFDPGRLKCGVAVMKAGGQLLYHQVVASDEAMKTLQSLHRQFSPSYLIMGDQTTSKSWKQQLETALPTSIQIVLIDERYSSLEARDRYWELYPPAGLMRLVPKGMRQPPRPVDDIVAVVLIERYLQRQTKKD